MEEMNELFYKDAYRKEFDAKVLQCREGKKDMKLFCPIRPFIRKAADSPLIMDSWMIFP